jgi:hypothetical protein
VYNADNQLKIEALQSGGIVASEIIAKGANFIIREILKKEGI